MAASDSSDPSDPSDPSLRVVRDMFLAGEVDAHLLMSSVRPVVAQSWQRSCAGGVDPDFDGARSAEAVVASGFSWAVPE